MAKVAAIVHMAPVGAGVMLGALGALATGCLNSSNALPLSFDASGPDASIVTPPESTDGAVGVDAGTDAPAPVLDAGLDATAPTAFSGLGSGIVTHSAHFTLITKTGNEPGGAGVHGSQNFKVISGLAPSAAK
jgi:hypothetical protein